MRDVELRHVSAFGWTVFLFVPSALPECICTWPIFPGGDEVRDWHLQNLLAVVHQWHTAALQDQLNLLGHKLKQFTKASATSCLLLVDLIRCTLFATQKQWNTWTTEAPSKELPFSKHILLIGWERSERTLKMKLIFKMQYKNVFWPLYPLEEKKMFFECSSPNM